MPFEYRTFVNPYAPGIADTMLRSGDIEARRAEAVANAQAHATEASAAAWGGAAQSIGQTLAQLPQQLQRQKMAALQQQNLQSEITDRNAQAQGRITAQQANAAVDHIMQTSLKEDPQTGVKTFDRPTFEQGLIQAGQGHLYPALAETLDKLDSSASKRNAEGRKMIAETLVGIGKAGYSPESVLSGAAFLKGNNVITDQHLQPVLDAVSQDPSPANIQRVVTSLGNAIPEYGDILDRDKKREADLAKTTADTAKANAEAAKATMEANAGPKRTEAEQALDAFAKSIGKTRAEDLTDADRQAYTDRDAKRRAQIAFTQHANERNYDVAHPVPEKGKSQDALEQEARGVLQREFSSRSGGLGLEDQKVNQAIHLIELVNQYDGKPMPAQIHGELALGLAKLTSPNGNVGIELEKEFKQKTAQEGIAKAVAYLTGDPSLVNATPEALRDMLRESILRQGHVAEQNRQTYLNAMVSMLPTNLDPKRAEAMRNSVQLNRVDTVKMQAPTGQIQDVPRNQIEHYKARGAKVIGG